MLDIITGTCICVLVCESKKSIPNAANFDGLSCSSYKYTGARTYEYLCLIGIQILYTLLINRIEKLRRGSRNVVFGSATLSQRSCQLFHGALRVSSGKLDYSDFKFQVSVRLEKPDSSRGIILG